MVLSAAYDLLSTAIVNPKDDEDLALALNGKKKKIRRTDFVAAFNTMNLDAKQQENIFAKMLKYKSAWIEQIQNSFLSNEFKIAYTSLLEERFSRIM